MNKRIIRLLEEARYAATYENAKFGGLDHPELDEQIKEETRSHRNSWIIVPLDEALRALKKRDEIREKRRAKKKTK